MIRTLILFLLCALPASATQDGWPALFDVKGVAADDVLNIRSEPGASGDIVGSLANDAKNIEVIRPNESLTWGLVNTRDTSGWVALSFMQRQAGHWYGAMPEIRRCFGTEPFWLLAYDPPRITFSTPEGALREGLISGLHSSLSRPDRFALKGAFFPTEDGDRDIQIFLRTEVCTDGMSDREYGIAADMLLTRTAIGDDDSATGLYSGCCTIQP